MLVYLLLVPGVFLHSAYLSYTHSGCHPHINNLYTNKGISFYIRRIDVVYSSTDLLRFLPTTNVQRALFAWPQVQTCQCQLQSISLDEQTHSMVDGVFIQTGPSHTHRAIFHDENNFVDVTAVTIWHFKSFLTTIRRIKIEDVLTSEGFSRNIQS